MKERLLKKTVSQKNKGKIIEENSITKERRKDY